jgi:hypothetical protein
MVKENSESCGRRSIWTLPHTGQTIPKKSENKVIDILEERRKIYVFLMSERSP